MTSVKRYPHLGGFVGWYSEYTFVREAVAGGTPRGTQDRTGVYLSTEAMMYRGR